jgi:hypothetical protein
VVESACLPEKLVEILTIVVWDKSDLVHGSESPSLPCSPDTHNCVRPDISKCPTLSFGKLGESVVLSSVSKSMLGIDQALTYLIIVENVLRIGFRNPVIRFLEWRFWMKQFCVLEAVPIL